MTLLTQQSNISMYTPPCPAACRTQPWLQVLVLEYLSGGEMLRQLQRLKRYSEANACQMFKQVCGGLLIAATSRSP